MGSKCMWTDIPLQPLEGRCTLFDFTGFNHRSREFLINLGSSYRTRIDSGLWGRGCKERGEDAGSQEPYEAGLVKHEHVDGRSGGRFRWI